MLETLALTALMALSPFSLNASDAWSDPYDDPIDGDRVKLLSRELSASVKDVKADLSLSRWVPFFVRLSVSVSARNPGPTWLRFVRVDVAVEDEAKLGKPQSASMVFTVIKPGETVTQVNDRLWARVTPYDLPRIRYKAWAQVVGGYRLTPKVKPKK